MPAASAAPGSPAGTKRTRDAAAPSGNTPATIRRRAGRPSSAVLDKAGITAAALDLISRNGYDGLTMAGLARLLDVAPSALYNHVTSKQDVLLLVEDHLAALVDVSGFGAGSWEDAVRTWAWSYRDVFAQHTPLIPVIAVLPVTDAPQTLAMYETVSRGFLDAGFPQERIVSSIVALESFIFGSAYDVTAPADIFDAGSMAGSTPHFTAAVQTLAEQGHERPADAAFRLGLEALIAGLGALRG
ncbi:TetR/AcrR family transcriptional regulator C-terminal domain-containing protein [Arthrobacter sp. ISL-48]|uniref:TetR/AcrR family transcriptional regulator n=1 Tax=Arthrobacter sp. ISL-48 TaxID=2819110 RepID=UPI001BEA7212|nr:TetR/AcrR family transcriptional regulator C-terminal domain-containing protein [Arthrobacter sp. ISL-48]MBT2533431.1 TetR/AcrR family transcriptional regulator C-terminal domain-containing protein [Arthrobacter sp. ISL-48]